MATMTLSNPTISGLREVIVSLITSLFRFAQHFIKEISGPKTDGRGIEEVDAEFEKAVRTIQLAAEPGENYAEIAAKVRREALSYRNFLQHPQPIGRISLCVRELDRNEPDFGKPRTQWLVEHPSEGGRDPVEGGASVSYRLSRSATKVLEFVLHDTKDAPLFAIVRTYSNWLGTKKFELGPNRVFYLDMKEELPGYVEVKAGFRPATAFEDDNEDTKVREFARPVPVPPSTETQPEPHMSIFRRPPQPRRFVYLAKCAAVSMIVSTVTFAVIAAFSKSHAQVSSGTSSATPVREATGRTVAIYLDQSPSLSANAFDIGQSGVLNQEPKTMRVRSVESSKRLADVKSFSIAVDNNSCKEMESQCRALLSTIQQEVKSNLSSLNIPVLRTDQVKTGKEPAKLVVSYNPTNLLHGQIHLTLYDQQGALWSKGNLSYAKLTEPDAIRTYCEEASNEIVWEIIMAKAQMNFDRDTTATGSAKSE